MTTYNSQGVKYISPNGQELTGKALAHYMYVGHPELTFENIPFQGRGFEARKGKFIIDNFLSGQNHPALAFAPLAISLFYIHELVGWAAHKAKTKFAPTANSQPTQTL